MLSALEQNGRPVCEMRELFDLISRSNAAELHAMIAALSHCGKVSEVV